MQQFAGCFIAQHRGNEDSPVVEHFTGDRHTQADIVVMVIDQLYHRDPCLNNLLQTFH